MEIEISYQQALIDWISRFVKEDDNGNYVLSDPESPHEGEVISHDNYRSLCEYYRNRVSHVEEALTFFATLNSRNKPYRTIISVEEQEPDMFLLIFHIQGAKSNFYKSPVRVEMMCMAGEGVQPPTEELKKFEAALSQFLNPNAYNLRTLSSELILEVSSWNTPYGGFPLTVELARLFAGLVEKPGPYINPANFFGWLINNSLIGYAKHLPKTWERLDSYYDPYSGKFEPRTR